MAQTEWHECTETFGKLIRRHAIGAGYEIQLENGKTWLIGDINPLGGVCDDCCGVYQDDVVKRYRVVVPRDREEPCTKSE